MSYDDEIYIGLIDSENDISLHSLTKYLLV